MTADKRTESGRNMPWLSMLCLELVTFNRMFAVLPSTYIFMHICINFEVLYVFADEIQLILRLYLSLYLIEISLWLHRKVIKMFYGDHCSFHQHTHTHTLIKWSLRVLHLLFFIMIMHHCVCLCVPVCASVCHISWRVCVRCVKCCDSV